MTANIVNLTPHVINVVGKADFSPSGKVARVATTTTTAYTVNGIDVLNTVYGDVVDLPDPVKDTFYIVSRLVKTAVPSRTDVLCPGILVRDADGKPIGCNGLSL
jgi:hypothetical protein